MLYKLTYLRHSTYISNIANNVLYVIAKG